MGKLISENFLIGLTVGSYESLINRIEKAANESRDLFELKDNDQVRVFATFKKHVIVLNESGDLFRSEFEDSDVIKFSNISKVDISNYTIDEETTKIMASSIVEDILSGKDLSQKLESFAATIPLNEDYESDRFKSKVEKIFEKDRFWRKFVGEQAEDIGILVYGEIKDIDGMVKARKYENLYTGKIPENEFELHAESVADDMNEIVDKLSIVEQNIKTSLEIYEENEELFKEEESLSSIDEFIDDILDDIDIVQEKISAAINEYGHCPACMGFIYDEFANNIGQYEIASEFVGRIINITVEQ